MRLLTHNYLISNVRGTQKGYPLIIEPTKVDYMESPVDYGFIQNILSKLDFNVFLHAAQQIAPFCHPSLPTLPQSLDGSSMISAESTDGENMKELMRAIHSVLMDYHVVEGFLVCPDTKRKFTIVQGIPNMILHEDEL